jgi:hypothetical protein
MRGNSPIVIPILKRYSPNSSGEFGNTNRDATNKTSSTNVEARAPLIDDIILFLMISLILVHT